VSRHRYAHLYGKIPPEVPRKEKNPASRIWGLSPYFGELVSFWFQEFQMIARKRPLASDILLALLLAAVAATPGCSARVPEIDWAEALRPVREKYAPDTRLTLFDVEVHVERGELAVSGEVEDAAAGSAAVARVRAVSGKQVRDSIRVLPDASLGTRDRALVNVSVGNVRRHGEHSAELVTQVLLGDTVRLLEKKGSWLRVQCPDRYLGWIDEEAVLPVDPGRANAWNSADRVIVTQNSAILRSAAEDSAEPVCDLVVGDVLRLSETRGQWYEATLPDDRRGFVSAVAAMKYEEWRQSRELTPENIEASARTFTGIPYLWGGTSSKGFDCSGFVKTVFALNGQRLDRDADQQARQGEIVDAGAGFEGLRRGDLLFFGRRLSAEKGERITHVGIYLADRRFIHCSGRVRISSLDPASTDYDEWHVKAFVRARRLTNP
jgi:gamma-D-glutamyl-L-lysine dipeptidyl-peptidase